MPWAGLGVLGNGVTWTLMPTSAGVMEHELGHNYGLNHGKTSKGERAGEDFNTPQWSGMSRISGGGSVYWQEERSRFNDNGHFGMGPKHWFGWIEDDHVVRMHPTTSGCPTCISTFSGKLNSFDRPDVVPGSTSTPYFGIRIEYETAKAGEEHLVYIYYRSSYARSRKGVSLQYCIRKFHASLNSGATHTCYDWDAGGDTSTMDDW